MIIIQKMFHPFFGDSEMTNVAPKAAASKSDAAADTRQIVLNEIGAKWDKLSQQELSALTAGTIS
jgi:hypothetical protein